MKKKLKRMLLSETQCWRKSIMRKAESWECAMTGDAHWMDDLLECDCNDNK